MSELILFFIGFIIGILLYGLIGLIIVEIICAWDKRKALKENEKRKGKL